MKRRLFAAIAAVSTFAFPACAGDLAAAKLCAEISADTDRLICFDSWLTSEGSKQEAAQLAPAATLETSTFAPQNRWKFEQESKTSAVASVQSPSGRSALTVTCNANKANPWLEVYPEGWIPNAPVQVLVDDRMFEVEIDGGAGAILSNLPDYAMGIDQELLNALTTGTRVSLIGPATAKMKDQERIYSLAGSSAAIAQTLPYCRG